MPGWVIIIAAGWLGAFLAAVLGLLAAGSVLLVAYIRGRAKVLPLVQPVAPSFAFTDDMATITEGEQEEGARDAMKAGLLWLHTHPKAQPQFRKICGELVAWNPAAEALGDAVGDSLVRVLATAGDGYASMSGGRYTGLFNAVMRHVMYAYRHGGWDSYVEESRLRKRQEMGW